MFASVVLYGWPAVAFRFFKAFSPSLAIILTILLGYLLLPRIDGLSLPLLPTLNSDSIPALAGLVLAAAFIKKNIATNYNRSWFPKGWVPRLLLCSLAFGVVMTTMTNLEPLPFVPGLSPTESLSTLLLIGTLLVPFVLGYRFIATPEQHRTLLLAFACAGFGYSFLALFEIRMSPQLNNLIYGFFPHSWIQHLRDGGYRPLVFLEHGLWLAIFFTMSALAAFGAARVYKKYRIHLYFAGAWILGTLALSNSLGALVILLLLLVPTFLLGRQGRLAIAAAIAVFVLSFPVLRERGLVTGDTAVGWAQTISMERANSLQFRLNNENILLEHANKKPLFGWGGWGRSRIYDEFGRNIAATDGYWVIIFGTGGWFRYVSEFGLLAAPLVIIFLRRRRYDVGPETITIGLMLSANLIDLLPNATVTPLTWMLAGSLWGRMEWANHNDDDSDTSNDDDSTNVQADRASVYTRQASFAVKTRF